MREQKLIGIGTCEFSQDPQAILIAPNLGSCLGIAVYDHVSGLGGLVHCLLPLSKNDPEKASKNPCLFVDTGFSFMLNYMLSRGVDLKKAAIVVAGGSNINDQNNIFEIGKKNYTILKKLMWKNNLLLKAEHCGDSLSRTLSLDIGTGLTTLKIQGKIIEF